MGDRGWEWDPSWFAGSAAYYVRGRVPYPKELVDALVAELSLAGRGRLLDVGCGPGSLTLLLAPWFEQATGLDPDAGMLAEAARQAESAGIANVTWLNQRAEDISPDLGRFRVATLAQSFHWMDRARVAGLLHQVVSADGALVQVHATTHQGIEGDEPLPDPRPPRAEIENLAESFLGSRRRAGQGFLPTVTMSEVERGQVEAGMFGAAGFAGPTAIHVPGRTVLRSADDIVASVFSLSTAAPHLFGDRLAEFEAALRDLLAKVSPDGRFSEQMRQIAVHVWRPKP